MVNHYRPQTALRRPLYFVRTFITVIRRISFPKYEGALCCLGLTTGAESAALWARTSRKWGSSAPYFRCLVFGGGVRRTVNMKYTFRQSSFFARFFGSRHVRVVVRFSPSVDQGFWNLDVLKSRGLERGKSFHGILGVIAFCGCMFHEE